MSDHKCATAIGTDGKEYEPWCEECSDASKLRVCIGCDMPLLDCSAGFSGLLECCDLCQHPEP